MQFLIPQVTPKPYWDRSLKTDGHGPKVKTNIQPIIVKITLLHLISFSYNLFSSLVQPLFSLSTLVQVSAYLILHQIIITVNHKIVLQFFSLLLTLTFLSTRVIQLCTVHGMQHSILHLCSGSTISHGLFEKSNSQQAYETLNDMDSIWLNLFTSQCAIYLYQWILTILQIDLVLFNHNLLPLSFSDAFLRYPALASSLAVNAPLCFRA